MKTIKRRMTVFVLMLMAIAIDASAQDVVLNKCGRPAKLDTVLLILDVDHVFSIRNKGMSMHGYDFNFGLKCKRVELFGTYERMSHHLGKDGVKIYMNTNTLGVGVGYDIQQNKKRTSFTPVRFRMAWPVGHPDWNNNYYDLSIHHIHAANSKAIGLNLGVGFRYVNSRSELSPNHGFVYWSVGIAL